MSARDRLRQRQLAPRTPLPGDAEGAKPGNSTTWTRQRIMNHLREDPAFAVMTVDGLNWIDPFTRQLVPAAFDAQAAALAWFDEHRPWRTQPKPLTKSELLQVRWSVYIREVLSNEPRLRFFLGRNRWLNPLNGAWVEGVALKDGQITREALAAMAQAMAAVEISSGKIDLQDPYTLKQTYERERNRLIEARERTGSEGRLHAPPAPVADPLANHGGLRISGRHRSADTVPAPRSTAPPTTGGPSAGILPRHLDELRNVGFLVGECLGQGGMAAVYKAIQVSLDREVALKVRLPGQQEFSIFVERFLQEAKLAAKIAHPHVVTVFDVGRTNSLVYMALEYLPGGDLDQLLRHHGQLPAVQALGFVRDILAGLKAIHAVGLIHRDIKTANCFLTTDGQVKVGDLGIARDIDHQRHMTNPEAILGTPAFMPPEQSVPGGTLDQRSDLYSAGVLAFHLISGVLPFDDANPLVILRKIITEPAPDLRDLVPNLNPEIARWVARLMDKDPANRPDSAQQAIDEMTPLLSG